MTIKATATLVPPKDGVQATYVEDSAGRRVVLTVDGTPYTYPWVYGMLSPQVIEDEADKIRRGIKP